MQLVEHDVIALLWGASLPSSSHAGSILHKNMHIASCMRNHSCSKLAAQLLNAHNARYEVVCT